MMPAVKATSRQAHALQSRSVDQRDHREHDCQPDHQGDVDEGGYLGDVDRPQPQGSVEPIPDRGVQYAAETEAVGEGVAGERGQGDPTERQRLAQVAKRQQVVEHQQEIARPGQPKRSADPFPA
jgi:hypothetical protein